MGKSAQLREEGQREGERADRGDAEDRKEKSGGGGKRIRLFPGGVLWVWSCVGVLGGA